MREVAERVRIVDFPLTVETVRLAQSAARERNRMAEEVRKYNVDTRRIGGQYPVLDMDDDWLLRELRKDVDDKLLDLIGALDSPKTMMRTEGVNDFLDWLRDRIECAAESWQESLAKC